MALFNGEKIKEIIKNKNLTQKEFAKKMDCSISAIAKVCGGFRTNPSISFLIKCANLLNCSISDFLDIDPKDGYKRSCLTNEQENLIKICNKNIHLKNLIFECESLDEENLIVLKILIKKFFKNSP